MKAAVIGVGYLGKHHARIYSALEGVELVGVVDPSEEARNSVAREYGTTPYADYHDILDKVDVLSVVTPTVTHYDIARDCLEAGKDILLEKPIASSVKEADDLIREAGIRGRIIQVGHLERYNPALIAMEAMVDTPRFIETERISPFQGRGLDVDITLDLMIHDIDIVMGLLGGDRIKDMKVVGSRVLTENIDAAKAWIEFESGASALVTASRLSGSKSRLLKVHQDGAYLMLDYQQMKIKRYTRSGGKVSAEEIDIEPKEPLMEEIRDFLDCVRERRRPRVSAQEGRDALEVALMLSHKIGKAVSYDKDA